MPKVPSEPIINVAIAGLGSVGRRTVKLLREHGRGSQQPAGARLIVAAVADRRARREARSLGLPASVRRETAPERLLDYPPEILVELLGGLETPRRLVLAALRRGVSVVTANKRLLAHCWSELEQARRASGARLYFEASVAGGIPILSALEKGLAANRIQSVHGILNGTTNYILSRAEQGVAPAEALKEAQRLGLAEKDPTLDLNGTDTAHKVCVLASLLTGSGLDPESIPRQGITEVRREDAAFASTELGRTVRLLGTLKLHWGAGRVRLEAHVAPTLVPLSHPLAAVRGEYNAVLVNASEAGDQMFYGKGAGPGPAASAVVSDVLMLTRDLLGAAAPVPRPARRVTLSPPGDSVASYYLRLRADDRPGVLAAISRALADQRVSIATIHQSPSGRGRAPVMITTHPAPQRRFSAAVGRILASGAVERGHAVMRLLE